MPDKKRTCSGEKELEVLRGKNRELQKQITRLENYIKFLENQLVATKRERTKNKKENDGDEQKNTNSTNTNNQTCDRCHKGEYKRVVIQAPNKVLEFNVCQTCYHRTPINSTQLHNKKVNRKDTG